MILKYLAPWKTVGFLLSYLAPFLVLPRLHALGHYWDTSCYPLEFPTPCPLYVLSLTKSGTSFAVTSFLFAYPVPGPIRKSWD